jgi:hypothetical protein
MLLTVELTEEEWAGVQAKMSHAGAPDAAAIVKAAIAAYQPPMASPTIQGAATMAPQHAEPS